MGTITSLIYDGVEDRIGHAVDKVIKAMVYDGKISYDPSISQSKMTFSIDPHSGDTIELSFDGEIQEGMSDAVARYILDNPAYYTMFRDHILECVDKELEEEKINVDGCYGFETLSYSGVMDAIDEGYKSDDTKPPIREIECRICKGTGKDKRNIIQKPCKKCEGTGTILE